MADLNFIAENKASLFPSANQTPEQYEFGQVAMSAMQTDQIEERETEILHGDFEIDPLPEDEEISQF